jgi:hypothetical protein
MLLRKLLLFLSIGALGLGLTAGAVRADDDDDDDDWEDRWDDWDDGPRVRVWRGDYWAPPPAVYYAPAPVYRYGYYEPVPYRVYVPPTYYVAPRVYRWAGPVIWDNWD